MKKEFQQIAETLNKARVRYVVAGGLADLIDIEYLERVQNEQSTEE